MATASYESPNFVVLGEVSDVTLDLKPGLFFDFPGSSEGSLLPQLFEPGTGLGLS